MKEIAQRAELILHSLVAEKCSRLSIVSRIPFHPDISPFAAVGVRYNLSVQGLSVLSPGEI